MCINAEGFPIDASLGKWRFAVDRGGTFTDVVAHDPSNKVHTLKLLSDSPHYSDPSIEGIRQILKLSSDQLLPSDQISSIRFGTTIGTNALLESKGASTGLIITKGFRDLLEIATQQRPHLFSLAIAKPEVLYREVIEISERVSADGSIISSLDCNALRKAFRKLQDLNIESIAIVFLHSWKNSTHENIAADIAREYQFSYVAVSHQTISMIQAVGRGQTTLLDAYLGPVLYRYIKHLRRSIGKIPVFFMGSAGELLPPGIFSGKDAVFSGPAGGVIAVAENANTYQDEAVIGFDMGGTSTDVSRYAGALEQDLEVNFKGWNFYAPMLRIKTVAAGGGSILAFDNYKLTVGPDSSGANPGPACYGHDGPAALTDANLLLGRILPRYLPAVFGREQRSPLNVEASRVQLRKILLKVNQVLNQSMSEIDLALGYVRIANEAMCRPIKELSITQGHDIRKHVLLCFGAAAGQHACGIARILGISKIRIPENSGVFSAYGIAKATLRRICVETVPYHANRDGLQHAYKRAVCIAKVLKEEICAQHDLSESVTKNFVQNVFLDVRASGTDHAITIPWYENPHALKSTFSIQYQNRFGCEPPNGKLELLHLRVEVYLDEPSGDAKSFFANRGFKHFKEVEKTTVWFESSRSHEVPVYHRNSLASGFVVSGPAVIVESYSTTLVEPGFDAMIGDDGSLLLSLRTQKEEKFSADYDPVLLEVFNHRFMGIAEQMGDTLVRTANSITIKERRDFSCAIFDSEGELVANAPHIPVHLGAMGETVRHLIKTMDFEEGDVVASNNPHMGGSHLPDITLVSAVFRNNTPQFYLACRAHHVDIGGVVPGSMPPFSRLLEEEGVVIDSLVCVKRYLFQEKRILSILNSPPYPARNISERVSDFCAQIASLQKGNEELSSLCNEFKTDIVEAYMSHIRKHAASVTGDTLCHLLNGEKKRYFSFADYMDDGTIIRVGICIQKNPSGGFEAELDFTGTSEQVSGNLNAPPAVTRAAVLYVFRTLHKKTIPLNDGSLAPIRIKIPEKSLLMPAHNAAVVGGNVETSQRIVDVLYGALNIAAASQGTMNNILFASPDGTGAQYYETVAGGAGAIEGFDGASAVQVHMTNTRMTDIEVIEERFPYIRIEKFQIRKNSGGKGKWRGGDGVVRSYRFLQPTALTVLSERRVCRPFGLCGGEAGALGKNLIFRTNGMTEDIGGKTYVVLEANDVLEISTPGGGGYGKVSRDTEFL